MEYAVIVSGGKQYKVTKGMVLDVELLKADVGKKLELKSVLAARTKKGFEVGTPALKGAKVVTEVVDHVKDKKVVNYKFKRRKGYHRKVGHRQQLTRLKVTEIKLNGA